VIEKQLYHAYVG